MAYYDFYAIKTQWGYRDEENKCRVACWLDFSPISTYFGTSGKVIGDYEIDWIHTTKQISYEPIQRRHLILGSSEVLQPTVLLQQKQNSKAKWTKTFCNNFSMCPWITKSESNVVGKVNLPYEIERCLKQKDLTRSYEIEFWIQLCELCRFSDRPAGYSWVPLALPSKVNLTVYLIPYADDTMVWLQTSLPDEGNMASLQESWVRQSQANKEKDSSRQTFSFCNFTHNLVHDPVVMLRMNARKCTKRKSLPIENIWQSFLALHLFGTALREIPDPELEIVGYSGKAVVLKGAGKPTLQGARLAGEQVRGRWTTLQGIYCTSPSGQSSWLSLRWSYVAGK